MSLAWRGLWVYGPEGAESSWRSRLPVGLWDTPVPTVGGRRRSASGVAAGYVVRRDNNLVVPVRYFEDEWEQFYNLLVWGQSCEPFFWYPDPDNYPEEVHQVDLESPVAGERFQPTRVEGYPRAKQLAVELHRLDGFPWLLEYYPGGTPAW